MAQFRALIHPTQSHGTGRRRATWTWAAGIQQGIYINRSSESIQQTLPKQLIKEELVGIRPILPAVLRGCIEVSKLRALMRGVGGRCLLCTFCSYLWIPLNSVNGIHSVKIPMMFVPTLFWPVANSEIDFSIFVLFAVRILSLFLLLLSLLLRALVAMDGLLQW